MEPSRPEWAPERVVTVAEAEALVRSAFPVLRGATVQPLAEGWDNTVHVVDGRWVFRFPRRAMAVPAASGEVEWLPTLARLLPLPVPLPEFVSDMPGPGDARWPYWGGRLLPGSELAESGLPDGARSGVAEDVGGFLRALHGPAVAELVGELLPVDPMGRADPGRRVPMARERLGRLERAGVWQADDATAALLADAEPLGPGPGPMVVCHGDLHVRHLLVADGRAAGVIDWGDLCRGDPAVDLSLAYGGFTGVDRAALLDAYGPVPADRELRARSLAVMLCAALAEYALAEGRAALLEESLAGLRRAVAR
ncbi:MAG: phosphotransferase [Kineosporiaceae bacterium]